MFPIRLDFCRAANFTDVTFELGSNNASTHKLLGYKLETTVSTIRMVQSNTYSKNPCVLLV